MDWTRSYSAVWRVFRVNRKTWADGPAVAKVGSASISRTANGNLLESGSMTATGEFETDYYRIVMTAEQGADVDRVDVATLLFDSAGGTMDYGTTAHSVNGYSVLYPAATTAITVGEYAPAGSDGAQYAASLLRSCINAPVEVEGSFVLNDHVVHELGSSVIDAVWSVLDAGGFIMQIDGRGVVHIRPKPTEPALVLDTRNSRLLQNGITFDYDLSEIPNRYIVVDNEHITIAVNDDPNSVVSTVSRGYSVDVVDTSPVLVNSETLGEYALRKLKEASVLVESREYAREYIPDLYEYSLIKASVDGISGEYRVESQQIECGRGIVVKEKASKETRLWI